MSKGMSEIMSKGISKVQNKVQNKAQNKAQNQEQFMLDKDEYRYRPWLFFLCAYFFTWIFWTPAIFISEDKAAILMLLGLLAPAVVSTVFVLASGSEDLKRDLKEKIIGFYKVKWMNVFWAVVLYALIIVFSILLSLLFGQSLKQFSFTEDFSFTGVGIGSAFVTITLASIIEEVGWKGYCEDSIGQYMDWFIESLIFGILWSLWHFPLLFIKGTYQAGLMVNPLFVINFFVGAILMGYIITWVYLVSDRSILACMVFHLFVNFMQEKIAMTAETKCVETIVIFIVTAIIVLLNKKMFFGTEHVGRLLKTRFGEGNKYEFRNEKVSPSLDWGAHIVYRWRTHFFWTWGLCLSKNRQCGRNGLGNFTWISAYPSFHCSGRSVG